MYPCARCNKCFKFAGGFYIGALHTVLLINHHVWKQHKNFSNDTMGQGVAVLFPLTR